MKPPNAAIKPRRKSAEKPALVAAALDLTMAATNPTTLLAEVRALIPETRQTVGQGVNSVGALLANRPAHPQRKDFARTVCKIELAESHQTSARLTS